MAEFATGGLIERGTGAPEPLTDRMLSGCTPIPSHELQRLGEDLLRRINARDFIDPEETL